MLDALRAARSTARPGREIDGVELTDGDVIVRCSPAASVTLYTGQRARRARERGPARLSERTAEILERDDDGLITAVRLERPFAPPYGRVEVRAANGTKGVDERAVDRVAAASSSARAGSTCS